MKSVLINLLKIEINLNLEFISFIYYRTVEFENKRTKRSRKIQLIDFLKSLLLYIFSIRWSGSMIWPCGSIVRYGKELYKAEAEMNSSEPGNSSQSRFYVRSEAKAKSY
jgi:hypothetical protein